jgi:hypothetical protein
MFMAMGTSLIPADQETGEYGIFFSSDTLQYQRNARSQQI